MFSNILVNLNERAIDSSSHNLSIACLTFETSRIVILILGCMLEISPICVGRDFSGTCKGFTYSKKNCSVLMSTYAPH